MAMRAFLLNTVLPTLAYAVFRAGSWVARRLSLAAGFRMGAWLGGVAWFFSYKHRRIALRNLELAYDGEISKKEIARIGRESFRRVGENLVASVKLADLSQGEITACVTLEISEELQRAREQHREGWVAAISHLGNWELYAQLRHFMPGHAFGAVYQTQRNAGIDRKFRELRARFGVKLFDRANSLVAAAKFLREGGVLGVLMDQYAGEPGVWTPLFGRLASTTPLPATLALHAKVPVVPIAVFTTGAARWTVVIYPPIYAREQDPDAHTAELNAVLETQIRRSPEDWLWAHDRWKTPRPGFLLGASRRGATVPSDWSGNWHPFRMAVVAPTDLLPAIAATESVRGIRAGREDAHVTLFAPMHLHALWHGVEGVDEVRSGLPDAEKFEAVFDFSNGTYEHGESFSRLVRATGDPTLTATYLEAVSGVGGMF